MVGLRTGSRCFCIPACLLWLTALAGCTAHPAPRPRLPGPGAPSGELYVPPSSYDFSRNPKLLERILAGPHGYFRFINIAFADAVCRRFAGRLDAMPTVNLHGDPHLEQYAVTGQGHGLADFDDAGTGPAVIDILRFCVSVRLACRALDWDEYADEAVAGFMQSYTTALQDPRARPPEPGLVARVRRGFSDDPSAHLAWVGSIMEPVEPAEHKEFARAFAPYVQSMLSEKRAEESGFFRILALGRHHIGIGSAMDVKYLLRVEGPTAAPEDDLVLEAKEVRDLAGISCIRAPRHPDPFRILVAHSRIAYRPDAYLGSMRLRGRAFWIHAWSRNHHELDIGASFETRRDLLEVVRDAGFQLGRGHTNRIAAPLDARLRRAQLACIRRHRDAFSAACRDLTTGVVAAWKRFRSEVKPAW